MGKALTPNKHGLVVVKLTKAYGSNMAGETAGFLPAVAAELIKNGAATSFAPAEGQHAIEQELKRREDKAGGAGGEFVSTDIDSAGNPTPAGNDAQAELDGAEVTTRKFTKAVAKKAGVSKTKAAAKTDA